MLDRTKLAKLLALTTSSHEGEVVNAISMANAMLAREKMTWAEVLVNPPVAYNISVHRQPYKAEENWTPPHLKDAVIIDLMFRTVFAQPRTESGFWDWLDDVHMKWHQYGALTQGQYDGLRNSYNRVKRAAS